MSSSSSSLRRRADLAAACVLALLAGLGPVPAAAAAAAPSRPAAAPSRPAAAPAAAPSRPAAAPAGLERAEGQRAVVRLGDEALPQQTTRGRSLARAADGTPAAVLGPAPVPAAPGSSIDVTFAPAGSAPGVVAFPPAARAAFERAAAIWEGILISNVPIRVTVAWSNGLGDGVLGGAAPGELYRGPGVGDGNDFHPSALADALVGRDLAADFGTPGTAAYAEDVQADFSSVPCRPQADGSCTPFAWHFDTTPPPIDTVDFATVVLHELGHGLGFATSVDVVTEPSTGIDYGYFGIDPATRTGISPVGKDAAIDADYGNDIPFRFDSFVASADGTRITRYPNSSPYTDSNGTFEVPFSPSLGAALQRYTGWTGQAGRAAYSGESPPLYTPPVWEAGSSFAHLDERAFPATDPNSLMTPYLSAQEQVLDPGAITVGMMRDLGWKTQGSRTPARSPSYGFTALPPERILDTRTTNGGPRGAVGPGRTRVLQVSRRGGVPSSATAVVLNVTAVDPATSFVTVFPADEGRPEVSHLSTRRGETVANLVTVRLDAIGRVKLYNAKGSTDLLADVTGYYSDDPGASGYQAVTPTRLLDTRSAGPVAAGQTRSLRLRGRAGLPADVAAVVLNVTAVDPSAASFVTAYPTGTARPASVSSLNTRRGVTTPNLVTVRVGAGVTGGVVLYNAIGTTHLLVDLAGYFAPSAGGRFVPLAPRRIADSRPSAVSQGAAVTRTRPQTLDLQDLGLPASATSIVANVTAVGPTAASYVTVHPAPVRPPVSHLNLRPGVTVANLVAVGLGTTGADTGRIRLYNDRGSVHLVTDLAGYYR